MAMGGLMLFFNDFSSLIFVDFAFFLGVGVFLFSMIVTIYH